MKEEKDEEDIGRECDVNGQVLDILTPRERFGIAESEKDSGELKKENQAEKKSGEGNESVQVLGCLSE